MTNVNQDDGCTYLSRNEHWCVSGYVTIRVPVSFDTWGEPGDRRFDMDLEDAVNDIVSGEWELEDSDGLDFEAESDDVYL